MTFLPPGVWSFAQAGVLLWLLWLSVLDSEGTVSAPLKF